MTVDLSGRTLLSKYRIERMLGQGGMGTVWQGVHTLTGRKIAIKMLDDRFLSNLNVVQRFGREARAASAIHHEGIVEVLDLDQTEDGRPFLVMEYLDGELLSRRIDRRGKIPQDELVHTGSLLLDALHAAHQSGVVHRDLKPDNIFLVPAGRRGEMVKILDFGISSKDDETQAKLTVTGSVLGTPHYMSPEQAMGDTNLDRRVDVYGAAIVLYECCVGDVPYDGANYNKLLRVILDEEPVPPRKRGADISEAVERVILKGMAKKRDQRYSTALEFKKALDDAGAGRSAAHVGGGRPHTEESVVARWMATSLDEPPEAKKSDTPSGDRARGPLETASRERPRAVVGGTPLTPGPVSPGSGPSTVGIGSLASGALDAEFEAPGSGSLEFDEQALASVRGSSAGKVPSPLREAPSAEAVRSASRSSGRFPAVRDDAVASRASTTRATPPRPVVAALPPEAEAPARPAWQGLVLRIVGGVAVFVLVVFALRFAVRGGGAAVEPTTGPGSSGSSGLHSGPEWVAIEIDGIPASARLRLDGLPGASLPLRLRRGTRHVLEIDAEGYEVRQIRVQADEDQRLQAGLRPVTGAPR